MLDAKAVKNQEYTETNLPNLTILRLATRFTAKEGLYSYLYLYKSKILATTGSLLFVGKLPDLPTATIPAEGIAAFLTYCPEKDLRWSEVDDGNSLLIRSGNYKFKVPKMYTTEIPKAVDLFGNTLATIKQLVSTKVIITEELIKAFKSVGFCTVSDNKSAEHIELQGVYVDKDGVYASNGYGLARYKIKVATKIPFTLPLEIVKFMVDFRLPPKTCSVSKNYIVMNYVNFYIIAALNTSLFPIAYFDQLDTEEEYQVINFKKDVSGNKKKLLRRLGISAGSNIVVSSKEYSTLDFSVSSSLGYSASETVSSVQFENYDIPFIAGLNFFKEGFYRTDTLKVAASDNGIKLLFTKGDFSYLIRGRATELDGSALC